MTESKSISVVESAITGVVQGRSYNYFVKLSGNRGLDDWSHRKPRDKKRAGDSDKERFFFGRLEWGVGL